MPRRNQRESYEPLDLTSGDIRKNIPQPISVDPEWARRQRAMRAREAATKQRNARINRGIDWAYCLVPGCGEELRIFGMLEHNDADWRDHTVILPLCINHLAVARQQAVSVIDNPVMVQAHVEVTERKAAKQDSLREAAKKAWLAKKDGHIYFVRLNGLVKVGWSRDVQERLRAYGPDVEVLAVYRGTQQDETNLHRQLKPALARGREWYEDGPIVKDFVTHAVKQHGPPQVVVEWTKPKQIIKPRKRAS